MNHPDANAMPAPPARGASHLNRPWLTRLDRRPAAVQPPWFGCEHETWRCLSATVARRAGAQDGRDSGNRPERPAATGNRAGRL